MIWKEIPLLPDYKASEKGDIKDPAGQKIRQFKHGQGWMIKIDERYWQVRMLVASAFLNYQRNKHFIKFKNNDKFNASVENLELGDSSQRCRQAALERRDAGIGNIKLSRADIPEIKRLYYEDRLKIGEISKFYNVTHRAIEAVVKGITWNK